MCFSETPVFNFSDFRTFLLAHAQQMKGKRSSWSLGAWARTLGLRSTSSLTKVINGERNPGDELTARFIQYFQFSESEEQHFRDLVQIQKLKSTPSLSEAIEKKVQGKKRHNFAVVSNETFSALCQWYCYAIREMVNLKDFSEDPHWIAQRLRFRVSVFEIRRALNNLLSVGLLVRTEEGKLILGNPHVDTQNDVASEAIKQYHEQSLLNTRKAVRSVHVENRELTSTTFVMRAKSMPEAKKMIREFRKQFASQFEDVEEGQEVFQLQISFVPLTKSRKSGESNHALKPSTKLIH